MMGRLFDSLGFIRSLLQYGHRPRGVDESFFLGCQTQNYNRSNTRPLFCVLVFSLFFRGIFSPLFS